MEVFKAILEALGGLVLFLYGVTRLSESLQNIAGDRMKKILFKFTSNPFIGVLTGLVATTILDSSSVTIIMIIALVNAKIIDFSKALGVIMGANIGTTISSQIIAFQIDEYSSILLLAGFLLYFIAKKEIWNNLGLVLFGFGLIFFGLQLIGDSAEPLKDYQPFINWMEGLQNPFMGVLVGALFTILIQSSSATIGIVVTLASQGLISLPAGISIMLGAEIGTCADTIIATVGRSRDAIRAGVFHLFFNIITVIAGIYFAETLAVISKGFAPASISRQIANAHVIFNFSGVVIFIWFTKPISKLLKWIVPDKQIAYSVQLQDE